MAEAKDRAAWARTSAVLAQIFNANRGEKDRPIDPMRFCPWVDPKDHLPPPPDEIDREFLRKAFPEHTPVKKGTGDRGQEKGNETARNLCRAHPG